MSTSSSIEATPDLGARIAASPSTPPGQTGSLVHTSSQGGDSALLPTTTPRVPKVSSLGLNPKDSKYCKKVAEEMLPLMMEIPLINFIKECVKGGQSLTDEEHESLGDLSGVWEALSGNGKLRSGDNELQSSGGKSRRGRGRSQSNNRNLPSEDNIPQPSDNIPQPGDNIPQVKREEDMYPLIVRDLSLETNDTDD